MKGIKCSEEMPAVNIAMIVFPYSLDYGVCILYGGEVWERP